MNHIECQFILEPFFPFNEILVAHLSGLGFESFTEETDTNTLRAYIRGNQFLEQTVKEILTDLADQVEVQFTFQLIEKINWNKKWEENFESVEVGSFCYVRAPFHESKPDFQHEIIIEPKMSFGTGHHQTTQMMIELMENINFQNKVVLDMGSGTGILAILAKRMGAEQVEAIDIEEWAYENMNENFDRNEVEVNGYLGDARLLTKLNQSFDVIIANINKNILLADFTAYNKVLKSGGLLLLSGFYQSDEDELLAAPELASFQRIDSKNKEGWSALGLRKG